jgi:hypothetical protein
MAKDEVLDFNKPRNYTEGLFRARKQNPGFVDFTKLSEMGDTNLGVTSSFRYDGPTAGIKSTQQLNFIDWSKFEDHTFFNSAQAKVNVAFDKIVNQFPFDGTRRDQEGFFDSLTGYEKYIFDIFPVNFGYLCFSGSANTGGSEGTFLKVADRCGAEFDDFSRNNSKTKAMDPGSNSFTVEMQLAPAITGSGDQVVCQMLGARNDLSKNINQGFSLILTGTTSESQGMLGFLVTSGSSYLQASASIDKGKFSHIAAVYDREDGENILKMYVNGKQVSTSKESSDMQKFKMNVSDFTIGSGSSQETSLDGLFSYKKITFSGSKTAIFKPSMTFSGAIDEFRFWHTARKQSQIEEFMVQNVYPSDDLKLYYTFNEPKDLETGLKDVVLDRSGNSLHTRIKNYKPDGWQRITGSDATSGPMIIGAAPLPVPVSAENAERNKVTFPNYRDVQGLNTRLLESGSRYDDKNPNLITRLIPPHFLIEGAANEGLPSEVSNLDRNISGASIPGSGRLYNPQIMMTFLFVWAKYFDELKMFIDHFSEIIHADYDSGASDQFLVFAAKYYGVDLPRIYNNVNISQYVYGENLETNYVRAGLEIKAVQNEIWRRIVANIQDLIQSKGTIYSIKSLIRASGIEPDNIFRFREFGSTSKKAPLTTQRVNRTEVSAMLDFSGSRAVINPTASLSPTGFLTGSSGKGGKPHIISPFLTGARLEVGYPLPIGTFVKKPPIPAGTTGSVVLGDYGIHGISNNPADGLLTSGSFTFEGIYSFEPPLTGSYKIKQSLCRMHVTGTRPVLVGPKSDSNRPQHGVMFNVVAHSGSNTVTLYGKPATGSVNTPLELTLTGANVFDGDKWNVSWGRYRSDDPVLTSSLSSSYSMYFLRCGKSSFGDIKARYVTSSIFKETTGYHNGQPSQNYLESVSATKNAVAPFIVIGTQSIGTDNNSFLNGTEDVISDARITDFSGKLSQFRFWSKGLLESEWIEHVKNFKSLGVEDPKTNFNFNTVSTGAFNRLRIDSSIDQIVTNSNSYGTLKLIDFSQSQFAILVEGTDTTSTFKFKPSKLYPWYMDQKNNPSGSNNEVISGSGYYHLTGSGFYRSSRIIKPETFAYSYLSPHFDELESTNKVRIRSWEGKIDHDKHPFATSSPVYEMPVGETPDDDPRFSIEFSCAQALSEDMLQLLSSLEFFDNALGEPNLLYSEGYPDLESMREIYFNRLKEKVNFSKFFDFFKWFDIGFSSLIEQLIPRKTRFLGVNFVVESHVFERHKYKYLHDEIYLSQNEREIPEVEPSPDHFGEIE